MADRLTIEQRRAQLGEAAILTARAAAELLPGATADNLVAFDGAGIVLHWRGRRLVVWGDVLRLVRGEREAIETTATPKAPDGRRLVPARGLPTPVAL